MKLKPTKRKITIVPAIMLFALVTVFGVSLLTGNPRQSNIGSSKASAQEPADLNNDNRVDVFDLSYMLGKWNTADLIADITQDGTVNIFDLSRLLGKWGTVDGTVTQSCPAYPAFPNDACTGVPAGTVLTPMAGTTISIANTVIDSRDILGSIYVNAPNVIIRKSRVTTSASFGVFVQSGSVTIEDTDFVGVGVDEYPQCNAGIAIGSHDYTARRVRLVNFSDGFRVSGGNNVLIEDSFAQICEHPGNHPDGVQGYIGGDNIVVRHNTIDAAISTGPIFFADNSRSAVVENNLLSGGSASIRIHDDHDPDIGPWVITGNRVVDGAWMYVPVNTTNTNCATTTWSDNRLVTIDVNYQVLTTGSLVPCN